MKKPPVNWKEKADQYWAELQELMSKHLELQRELAKRPRIVEKEVVRPWFVGVILGMFISLYGWLAYYAVTVETLQKPVLQPYPVELSRQKAWDAALMWQGRCMRAWEVLKDHHSGPNNGKAFAILDGENPYETVGNETIRHQGL